MQERSLSGVDDVTDVGLLKAKLGHVELRPEGGVGERFGLEGFEVEQLEPDDRSLDRPQAIAQWAEVQESWIVGVLGDRLVRNNRLEATGHAAVPELERLRGQIQRLWAAGEGEVDGAHTW